MDNRRQQHEHFIVFVIVATLQTVLSEMPEHSYAVWFLGDTAPQIHKYGQFSSLKSNLSLSLIFSLASSHFPSLSGCIPVSLQLAACCILC